MLKIRCKGTAFFSYMQVFGLEKFYLCLWLLSALTRKSVDLDGKNYLQVYF